MAPPSILLAVVTEGRHEMGVKTLTSILGLQAGLMTLKEPPFVADVKFVREVNDALNVLHRGPYAGALVVVHNTGFPFEFAVRAFDSGEDVVIGVSPFPVVDWDRVAKRAPGDPERIDHAGNVYNVRLGAMRADGYAPVVGLGGMSTMYVKRDVVDAMAKKFPDIVGDAGSLFVADAVEGGRLVSGIGRFLERHGKPVVADTEHQAVVCGTMDFAGSVGGRTYVR